MISIDVNALNDLAEVEKAIEKLSFVRDALKKAGDSRGRVVSEVFNKTFGPYEDTIKTRPLRGAFDLGAYVDKMLADGRSIGLYPYQEKIVTRFSDLTPEDLDEMNAGPAVWPKLVPFMDPQEAIQDDGIVCLIDGKKRKFLSRYVRKVHHMAWETYLERFDLPGDYPRTCADVIRQRQKLAVERGLGQTRTPEGEQEAEQQVQVTVPIRKVFGRRAASQQVSVQVDIGRSVNTTAERRKERRLGGLL